MELIFWQHILSTFRIWSLQIPPVRWRGWSFKCVRISLPSLMHTRVSVNLVIYKSFFRGLLLPSPLKELAQFQNYLRVEPSEQNRFPVYPLDPGHFYGLAILNWYQVLWKNGCAGNGGKIITNNEYIYIYVFMSTFYRWAYPICHAQSIKSIPHTWLQKHKYNFIHDPRSTVHDEKIVQFWSYSGMLWAYYHVTGNISLMNHWPFLQIRQL